MHRKGKRINYPPAPWVCLYLLLIHVHMETGQVIAKQARSEAGQAITRPCTLGAAAQRAIWGADRRGSDPAQECNDELLIYY